MAEAQRLIGRKVWDISPLWNLEPPRPLKTLNCPLCDCPIFYFKHARLFQRHAYPFEKEELKRQFRIDISVKCEDCGFVPFFGVHITQKEYEELKRIFIAHGINNLMLEYKHTGHWLVSPEYRKLRDLE